MKKLKYLLVATIMSTTLLFGCGSNEDEGTNGSDLKELTAQELVENVSKKDDTEIKSFGFDLETSIDVAIDAEEMSSSVKGSANIKGQADVENKMFKVNATVDVAEQKTEIECYISAAGEEPALYVNMNGMWFKQPMELGDVDSMLGSVVPEVDTDAAKDFDINKVLDYLADAKVETKGDTYVLSGTIDFAKIAEDNAPDEESDEEDGAAINLALESIKNLKINIKVAINADYTLNSFEINVDKFETEIMGAKLNINGVTLKFSADKYNEIEKITIPEEALNAMEMDMSGMM